MMGGSNEAEKADAKGAKSCERHTCVAIYTTNATNANGEEGSVSDYDYEAKVSEERNKIRPKFESVNLGWNEALYVVQGHSHVQVTGSGSKRVQAGSELLDSAATDKAAAASTTHVCNECMCSPLITVANRTPNSNKISIATRLR